MSRMNKLDHIKIPFIEEATKIKKDNNQLFFESIFSKSFLYYI